MATRFVSVLPETDDEEELTLRRQLDAEQPETRADAALRLGAAYRKLNPAAARRLLTMALGGSRLTQARALLRLSYICNQEEDPSQARDYLARARAISDELEKESPSDHELIARHELIPLRKLVALRELIALRVDIAIAFGLLSQLQDAVGLLVHLDGRVQLLRESDLDSDDAWREMAAAINLCLGQLLSESEPSTANEALRKAIAWGSGSIEATAALHRGWLLEHRLVGLSPETEEQYRHATELEDPVVAPLARVSLGDALWRSGLPDLAREEWRQAAAEGDSEIAVRVESRLLGRWPYDGGVKPLSPADAARKTRPLPVHPATAVGRTATGRAPDQDGRRRKRVIIVGAGTGGHYLLPGLRHAYHVIAFVDDNPNEEKKVDDVSIEGTIDELESVIGKSGHVDQIIFAIPTASGATRNRVLHAAHRCGVDLVTLPSMFELRLGHPLVPQLRPLEVFETFGDFTWHVDREAAALVRGRRVAIAGAGDGIGRALALRVAHGHARHVLLLDETPRPLMKTAAELRNHRAFDDADVRIVDCADATEVTEAFADFSPEVVFHCAGLNHVPPPALRPSHAARANVLAASVVATAAAAAGATDFLLASTDRAAHRAGPFDWTKALAETAVLELAKPPSGRAGGLHLVDESHSGFRVAVLRLPNVWARDGAIVGRFIDQLGDGGPIYADPLVQRKFVPSWEAAQALLRLYGSDHSGGLFAYTRGEILDLNTIAERLIMVHGLVADRDIRIDRSPRSDTKIGIHLVGDAESAGEDEVDGIVPIAQSPSLVAELKSRLSELTAANASRDTAGRERALSDKRPWSLEDTATG